MRLPKSPSQPATLLPNRQHWFYPNQHKHELGDGTSEFGGHMLKRRLSHGFLLTSIFVWLSAAVLGQTTVVRAERMLDVASGETRRPGVVVIEGDRIRGVNPA